ncbi:MAG: hypothetical protein ACXVED_07035, partial [Bacteroidia bacterium]
MKRALLLFVVVGLFFTCFLASKFIRTKGYNSLWDFVTTYSSNYFQGLKARPENISIEIKEKDFKILQKN